MAMALTDALPSGLDLTIFDPAFRDEEEQGRGYPYQRDEMHPLVNAPARMMSVRVNDSDHFSRWHERQHGKSNGQDVYVSRPVFGDYLRDCLIDLRRQRSRRDGLLHRVPEEAMSLDGTEGGKHSVRTPRATYVDFDHVALCTGWRREPHAYPLSDSVMRTMAHPSVGVVGTGLTAVDFNRALLQSGYSGRIVAASRRGLLPAARSQWSCPQPAVFTPDLIDRSEVLAPFTGSSDSSSCNPRIN